MTVKPEEHFWSSYNDYIGARPKPYWLHTDVMKEHFGDANRYRQFAEEMLTNDYQSPLLGIVGSTLLGSEPFIQEIMATHLDGKQIERDVPAIRELSKFRKIEMILDNVREVFEDRKLAQKTAIYLAHRYSGARLRELGTYFGKKDSAIAQTTKRFTDEIALNKGLKTIVDNLGKRLELS